MIMILCHLQALVVTMWRLAQPGKHVGIRRFIWAFIPELRKTTTADLCMLKKEGKNCMSITSQVNNMGSVCGSSDQKSGNSEQELETVLRVVVFMILRKAGNIPQDRVFGQIVIQP